MVTIQWLVKFLGEAKQFQLLSRIIPIICLRVIIWKHIPIYFTLKLSCWLTRGNLQIHYDAWFYIQQFLNWLALGPSQSYLCNTCGTTWSQFTISKLMHHHLLSSVAERSPDIALKQSWERTFFVAIILLLKLIRQFPKRQGKP